MTCALLLVFFTIQEIPGVVVPGVSCVETRAAQLGQLSGHGVSKRCVSAPGSGFQASVRPRTGRLAWVDPVDSSAAGWEDLELNRLEPNPGGAMKVWESRSIYIEFNLQTLQCNYRLQCVGYHSGAQAHGELFNLRIHLGTP